MERETAVADSRPNAQFRTGPGANLPECRADEWSRRSTNPDSTCEVCYKTVRMSLADEARMVRQRVAQRLRELEPLVREYNELRDIAAEIGLEEAREPQSASTGRGARMNRGARRAGSPGRSVATRAQAPPARVAERVLEAVRSNPGKTVAEYAVILGVSATALYRPVRELTNNGTLVKRARQLFPG
jgi:hypothetical protein